MMKRENEKKELSIVSTKGEMVITSCYCLLTPHFLVIAIPDVNCQQH